MYIIYLYIYVSCIVSLYILCGLLQSSLRTRELGNIKGLLEIDPCPQGPKEEGGDFKSEKGL